jgi:hypothetical protein
VGEAQGGAEHHGHGKDGANGILEVMSALYSQLMGGIRPRRGLDARQCPSLKYPARSLSFVLATDV